MVKGSALLYVTRIGSAEGVAEGSQGEAPKARQKVARGKREARSPWIASNKKFRPEGPTECRAYGASPICRPCGARAFCGMVQGRRARCASPWPLATICRACGASPWLPSAAPAALAPGYLCRACGASPWSSEHDALRQSIEIANCFQPMAGGIS
jgi:hypothetical protein